MKKLYLETSVVSYLVALPSRDLIKAARQELTEEWWNSRRHLYDVYVSQLVLDEARQGDSDAANRRMLKLVGIPLLELTPDVTEFAETVTANNILPVNAIDDILHFAAATVHNIHFLLTWNCRHLANAEIRGSLYEIARLYGYTPPDICTPDELLETNNV